jgi:hypothetical protein
MKMNAKITKNQFRKHTLKHCLQNYAELASLQYYEPLHTVVKKAFNNDLRVS